MKITRSTLSLGREIYGSLEAVDVVNRPPRSIDFLCRSPPVIASIHVVEFVNERKREARYKTKFSAPSPDFVGHLLSLCLLFMDDGR